MKSLRWGMLLGVIGGAVLLTGCQSPIKILSRGEYDRLRQIEQLNKEQAALNSSLIGQVS